MDIFRNVYFDMQYFFDCELAIYFVMFSFMSFSLDMFQNDKNWYNCLKTSLDMFAELYQTAS